MLDGYKTFIAGGLAILSAAFYAWSIGAVDETAVLLFTTGLGLVGLRDALAKSTE